MNLTFRQLRIFVEVAERGSMQHSANALHLTPPAVSMQIKEIESQVGLPVFTRNNRRLVLSAAGEHLLVYARQLLATLKEAEDDIARLKRPHRNHLTIGIVNTAEYFAPHLLALFRAAHPAVDIKIRVAKNREQLVGLMDSGEIELSIMARLPKNLVARAETFATNPYMFVCAPEDPLLDKTGSPVQVLNEREFIVRERGSGTRMALESFFTKHRCSPQIGMEIASNETIKQSVMAGIGVGFMSLHCINIELRHRLLGVLDIVDTPVMEAWNLVHLQSRVLSAAAEAFRSFILQHGEAYLRSHDSTFGLPTVS